MTLLMKDPAAVLDYAIDWGAQYLDDGDLLADSSWSVDPDESGGVAIVGSLFGDRISTVQAGGGIPGRLYRLANRISWAIARTASRPPRIEREQAPARALPSRLSLTFYDDAVTIRLAKHRPPPGSSRARRLVTICLQSSALVPRSRSRTS